jgi:formylglycine-generating enzyme required for sulfatase activity
MFGARVETLAGAIGPTGLYRVDLPVITLQDPGTLVGKGFKSVPVKRSLAIQLDRSVAGKPLVKAAMTFSWSARDTTFAPNPAVFSGRLLPVTASYGDASLRSTFQMDGVQSAGLSGGVATGELRSGRLLLAGVAAGYESFSASLPTTIFERAMSVARRDGGVVLARGVFATSKAGVGMSPEIDFYRDGSIEGRYRKADWGTKVVAKTVSSFSDDTIRGLVGFKYVGLVNQVLAPFALSSRVTTAQATIGLEDLVDSQGTFSAGGRVGKLIWNGSALTASGDGTEWSLSSALSFNAATGFFTGSYQASRGGEGRAFSGVLLQSGPMACVLISDDGRMGSGVVAGSQPVFLAGGDLPKELTLLAGQSVDMDVGAVGDDLVFEWYKRSEQGDWLRVASESTSRFRFREVDWMDGGDYRVLVYPASDRSKTEAQRKKGGKQLESTCKVRVLNVASKPVVAWVRDPVTGVEKYVVVDVEIEAVRPPIFDVALTVPEGMSAIRIRLSPYVDQTSGLMGSKAGWRYSLVGGPVLGASLNQSGDLTLSGALFRDASDAPISVQVNVSEDPRVYSPATVKSGRLSVQVVKPPIGIERRHVVQLKSGMKVIDWERFGAGTRLTGVAPYVVTDTLNPAFVPGNPTVNRNGNLVLNTALMREGRYQLPVMIDVAGVSTAVILELECIDSVGGRLPEFVVRRDLTTDDVGSRGVDAVMSWQIGADVFRDGVLGSNGYSVGSDVWSFAMDVVPTGAVNYADLLDAKISEQGELSIGQLPGAEFTAKSFDIYVVASSKTGASRRGIVRLSAVQPAQIISDGKFKVYTGGAPSKLNALPFLNGLRTPVVLRDTGNLSGAMQLRPNGEISGESQAFESFRSGAVMRGLFDVLEPPLVINARFLDDKTATVVGGKVSEDWRGATVTGSAFPLGTRVAKVDSAKQTLLLTRGAEVKPGSVYPLLIEPRALTIAVDLQVQKPDADLSWRVPFSSGALRLNLSQALKDGASAGSNGSVVAGTSIAAALREAGWRFAMAEPNSAATVSEAGIFEVRAGVDWTDSNQVVFMVNATRAGVTKRVQIKLDRVPEQFSLSFVVPPLTTVSEGYFDLLAAVDPDLELRKVALVSSEARKPSGAGMGNWTRMTLLGRVGEYVGATFTPRPLVFGPVYHTNAADILGLYADEGSVVFMQEQNPLLVRGLRDVEFVDGALRSTRAGVLKTINGEPKRGDLVQAVDSAFADWDGTYRVLDVGGVGKSWMMRPEKDDRQGFYQVLKRGRSSMKDSESAWVLVGRKRAVRVGRNLPASFDAKGRLRGLTSGVLSLGSESLEVGTPLVVDGQEDVSRNGLYSVASLGALDQQWQIVKHLSGKFQGVRGRVSEDCQVTPTVRKNFVIPVEDAGGFQEGDLVLGSGDVERGVYRLAGKRLFVLAKVRSDSPVSASETIRRSNVVVGLNSSRLPGKVAQAAGGSSQVVVIGEPLMVGRKVGDVVRLTLTGSGNVADNGNYRIFGEVAEFVKEAECLQVTESEAARLGGGFIGNIYMPDRMVADSNLQVGDRVVLPRLSDARYSKTAMEQQGGTYVVLQTASLSSAWVLAREPDRSFVDLGGLAGFAKLEHIAEGAVATGSSSKLLVDGRGPVVSEWLSAMDRGIYEVRRAHRQGNGVTCLVMSQVLRLAIDQGGGVEASRSEAESKLAGVRMNIECDVAGSVKGLVTTKDSSYVRVDSTAALRTGMTVTGPGVRRAKIEEIVDSQQVRLDSVASGSLKGTLSYEDRVTGRIQADLLPSELSFEVTRLPVRRGGVGLDINLEEYLGLSDGQKHQFEALGGLPPFVNATAFAKGILQSSSVPTSWVADEEVMVYRLTSGSNISYGKIVLEFEDPIFSLKHTAVAGADPQVLQIKELESFKQYKARNGLVDPVQFALEVGAPPWLSLTSGGALLIDCREVTSAMTEKSFRVTFADSRVDRTDERGIGEGYLVLSVVKPQSVSTAGPLRLIAGSGSTELSTSQVLGKSANRWLAPQVQLLTASGGLFGLDNQGRIRLTPPPGVAPTFSGAGIRMSTRSGVQPEAVAGEASIYAGEPLVMFDMIGTARSDWSYQWMKNGRPIAGATSAKLIIGRDVTEGNIGSEAQVGGITLTDEGLYSLVASNGYGQAESGGVYLKVVERAFIVDPSLKAFDPVSGKPAPILTPSTQGSRVTLSVLASGGNRAREAYIYRWYYASPDGNENQIPYDDEGGEADGRLLDRAAGWQLIIEDFSSADVGTYRVEVLLREEEEISILDRPMKERSWTVWMRPVITLQPRSLFCMANEVAVFRIQLSPEVHPSLDGNVPEGFLPSSNVRWYALMNGEKRLIGSGDTAAISGDLVTVDKLDGAIVFAEVTDPKDPGYMVVSREARLRVFNPPNRVGSENDGMALYEMRPFTFNSGSSYYRANVAATETTVGQWKFYIEDDSEVWMTSRQDVIPSSQYSFWAKPGFAQDDNHPVVNVSWGEARDYCNWLTSRTGYRWRMMTSSEWETLTDSKEYPWDGSWPPRALAGNLSRSVPTLDDGYLFTSPARRFTAVEGIFGLGGNVSEWLDEPYYEKRTFGGVQYERSFRSFVGPSWATRDRALAKTAYRGKADSGYRDNRVGFRVVAENLDYHPIYWGTVSIGDDFTPSSQKTPSGRPLPRFESASNPRGGATAEVVMDSGDIIDVNVTAGGKGYKPGEVVRFAVEWPSLPEVSLPEMEDNALHRVKVPAVDFGESEVTWGEWSAVVSWASNNGYVFDSTPTVSGKTEQERAKQPVRSVTWWDAIKWCNARSEMEGLTPCYYDAEGNVYRDTGRPRIFDATLRRMVDDELRDEYVKWGADGYRLPTEAEWEKAAREGTQGLPFGNQTVQRLVDLQANSTEVALQDTSVVKVGYSVFGKGIPDDTVIVAVRDGVFTMSEPATVTARIEVAFYEFALGRLTNTPADVSTLKKSSYGLRGVLGNVQEWCWDWYAGYDLTVNASYRGTDYDSASKPARYSVSPASGVATVGVSFAGYLTAGRKTITGIDDVTRLRSGMAVSGLGIPRGAVIRSVDSLSQVTLSLAATITTPSDFTAGDFISGVTLDTQIPDQMPGSVKVVVDEGHGYRNGDTIMFRAVLHPELNGTYEGITVLDSSTFIFSWTNRTGQDVDPISDFVDGTVTKLMSQRVFRGGHWNSASAKESRVFQRHREPSISVAYATSQALAATYNTNGAGELVGDGVLQVDGFTPFVGDRILVKDQADASSNGIYVVKNLGSQISSFTLIRDVALDESADFTNPSRQWAAVRDGSQNAKTVWKADVAGVFQVGITPVVYSQRPGYSSDELGFRVVRLRN